MRCRRCPRAKFIAALDAAAQSGRLRLDPACHPTCDTAQRQQRRQALQAKPWVVYAKTALAGPAAVQGCLSRYTQRMAIGNERLPGIRGDAVRPTTRVNGKHGQPNGRTVTTLDGVGFVEVGRRLLQHVVPSGFKRIRHCGLLAPAAKTQRLAAARQLPGMPAAKPVAAEAVADFMRRTASIDIEHCTDCKVGRWRVIGCQARNRGGVGAADAVGAVGAVGAVAVGTVGTAAATATQRPHQAAPQALHACRGPP